MFYNALGTSLGESPAPLTSVFACAWPINFWVARSCWMSASKLWVLVSAYLSGLLVCYKCQVLCTPRLQMSSQCKVVRQTVENAQSILLKDIGLWGKNACTMTSVTILVNAGSRAFRPPVMTGRKGFTKMVACGLLLFCQKATCRLFYLTFFI